MTVFVQTLTSNSMPARRVPPIVALAIVSMLRVNLLSAETPIGDVIPVDKDRSESLARLQVSLLNGPAYLRDLSTNDTGQIFAGQLIAPSGRYRLHVPMAVHPLGALETSWLVMKLRVGNDEQLFNTLAFSLPDGFVDLTMDVVTTAPRTPVQIGWAFEGNGAEIARAKSVVKPKLPPPRLVADDLNGRPSEPIDLVDPDAPAPIAKAAAIATCLMLRGVHAEPLPPVTIQAVQTDKITYRRGAAGEVTVELRNVSSIPQTVALSVEVAGGLDRSTPVSAETLTIPARSAFVWKGKFNTASLSWGCAIEASSTVQGYAAEAKDAVFSVPDHFWDVAIMATCPAQMTRDFVSMDHARQAASKLKDQGFNGFEAYFWAPCDFLDYTPKTERFFSGQTAYVQSVTGTRNLITACHELGIFATFYANLWGGSGEPAFEMMRRHPDWFGSANFHSGALDDAQLMTAGIIRGPGHKIWSFNQLNDKAGMGLFDYHADQILDTQKMFGWDGIRYDSYYSAPWTIAAMNHIRQRVSKISPDFLFAYNAFADAEYRGGAMDSLSGAMIMAEGLRIGPGSKVAEFVRGLDGWREMAWPYGTTIGPLYGFSAHSNDKKARPPSALDHVYMSSATIAAGGHPYYNRMENTIGKYPEFALRYAEYLYNTKMRSPRDPDSVVKFPAGVQPLAWRQLLRTVSLEGNRRRVVLHVLNVPEAYALGPLDMKHPTPLSNIPVSFQLPTDAKVSGAWLLTAVPAASHLSLPVIRTGNVATMTVPEVKFYGVVVLEFESALPIPEKLDARTARQQQQQHQPIKAE